MVASFLGRFRRGVCRVARCRSGKRCKLKINECNVACRALRAGNIENGKQNSIFLCEGSFRGMISKKYLAALAGSVLVLAPMLGGCGGDDSVSKPKVSHTATTVSETPEESETPTTEEPTEDVTEASQDEAAAEPAASGTTTNSNGSSGSGGGSGSRARANSNSSGSSGSSGGGSAGTSAAADPAPAPAAAEAAPAPAAGVGEPSELAPTIPADTFPSEELVDAYGNAGITTVYLDNGGRWEITDSGKYLCEYGDETGYSISYEC